MDNPVKKLNPLLRLAAISGVETAIKLHIRRGDDLDARDESGATPLILAAGKRRQGAVRLLLSAGANPTLADQEGMDALAHALKSGCPETIAILTKTIVGLAASESSEKPAEESSKHVVSEVESTSAVELSDKHLSDGALHAESLPDDRKPTTLTKDSSALPAKMLSNATTKVSPIDETKILVLDDEPLHGLFADDWEAEKVASAPAGDETVAEVARQVQEAIGRHKIVDRDEDWGDTDLHLPVRAVPLSRDGGSRTIRDLLLVALREGMVLENALIDVCSNTDGSRNEEAERLLAFVAGELGASLIEWTNVDESFLAEPSIEEDRLLTEAIEFAEELASGRNDPFRLYAKDLCGDLLEAEEEIALVASHHDLNR